MSKWEYKSIRINPNQHSHELDILLNDFGAGGWEAIHFVERPNEILGVIFKRPVDQAEGCTFCGHPRTSGSLLCSKHSQDMMDVCST